MRMAEPTPVPIEPPPPPRALPAWPADSLPSATEAEYAVRAVLAGSAGALDPTLTSRLSAELTEIERAAFGGADETARPVRAAAALRWRLGAAVITAPERGPVDADAVAQLLADADAVLGALKDSTQDAPPELADAVAGIRKSLVADAISLQNAVTRLGAPDLLVPTPAVPKPVEARVLSVVSGDLAEEHDHHRSGTGMWVLLALALVAGASYHAYAWYSRPRASPPAEGMPAGTTATPDRGGRTLVVTRDGKPLPGEELEKFRAAQRAKGKRVREFARGIYAVEPEESPGERSSP